MTLRIAFRVLGPVAISALLLVSGALILADAIPRGPQFAYLSDCVVWENIALADVRYGLHRQLTCTRSGKAQMTWSHDGRYLAYFNNADAIFTLNVLEMDTGDERTYYFDSNQIYVNQQLPLTWSPDGDRIAFVAITAGNNVQTLFTLDVATGDIKQLTAGERDATDPGWSPLDASVLLFRRSDGLYALDPDSDSPPVQVAPRARHLWTADGAQVGFSYESPTIRITDVNGTVREIALPGQIRLDEITASPGAEELAVVVAGASGFTVNRINTVTGRAEAVVVSTYYLGQVAWSPDGAWLAYVETDTQNGGDNIILHHVPSGRRVPFVTTPRRDWSPVWRPAK